MPHFISLNKFLQTNTKHGDFQILDYIYNESFPNLAILPVIYNNEMIFIRHIQRADSYIYKIDKIARIADIAKMKELLQFISTDLNVLAHNLNFTKKKHKLGFQNGFLLDIAKLGELKPDLIEIGFGSGRHILELAKNNLNKTIIGFEIHPPSIRQVINSINLYNINNLYICNIDARLGIQVIQSDFVEKIFLHFPVPWNKAKHRRVFSREFLEHSLRILKDSGNLNIRTDDFEYFQDCIKECFEMNCIHIEIYKNKKTNVISKYERKWNAMQKNIYDVNIFKQTLEIKSKDDVGYFEFPYRLCDLKLFCNKKWIEKDFFISIGNLYESKLNSKLSLAQITFGSFYMPFNTYLIMEDHKIRYLKHPLNIQSHRLAHKFLDSILAQKSELTSCLYDKN
ncbi:tRNA (guanosine(46)-N7)-methyltransferase TrmB [Helicobacter muridarum]|uniref:tRNA (guanine-N(7)-)-methyltransferase n=1 Tax=Helicobacter muridarum TaxID=216 RepID=A0A377PVP3_9HELI|nr:tRNA (guanosine(46)-N7)-methyltransferase TrmB [Helicobacter muridarum]TLE00875.1 tRNA (guanosine(46)-N7)-methyltransferase TrmB [Helicobacter muridarum]STQ86647.1 tRNA (guanine-N(7)-)-methyltransferase [Helicobacter muridarum]